MSYIMLTPRKWKFPKKELVLADTQILENFILSVFKKNSKKKTMNWMSLFTRFARQAYGEDYWVKTGFPLLRRIKEGWVEGEGYREEERQKKEDEKLHRESPTTLQIRENLNFLNKELNETATQINAEIGIFYSRDTPLVKKLRELFNVVEAMYSIVEAILEAKKMTIYKTASDDQMLILFASDYNESVKTLTEVMDSIFHQDKTEIGDNERGKDLYTLAIMYRNRLRMFKAKTDFVVAEVLKDAEEEDETKN